RRARDGPCAPRKVVRCVEPGEDLLERIPDRSLCLVARKIAEVPAHAREIAVVEAIERLAIATHGAPRELRLFASDAARVGRVSRPGHHALLPTPAATFARSVPARWSRKAACGPSRAPNRSGPAMQGTIWTEDHDVCCEQVRRFAESRLRSTAMASCA